jgi:hypothetical protein
MFIQPNSAPITSCMAKAMATAGITSCMANAAAARTIASEVTASPATLSVSTSSSRKRRIPRLCSPARASEHGGRSAPGHGDPTAPASGLTTGTPVRRARASRTSGRRASPCRPPASRRIRARARRIATASHRDRPLLDSPHIESVLRELREAVGRVLVVADGVSRHEQRRIDAVAAALGVDVLRLERSRGKGHAVAAGFEHLARAGELRNAVLVLDADGQHPPHRVGGFARALADADVAVAVAVADRSADRARIPAVRRLSSAFVAASPTPSVGCGSSAPRHSSLPLPRGGFETEARHLKELVTAGLRVAWVPIPAIYGGEESAFRPWGTAGASCWPRSPRSAAAGQAAVSARPGASPPVGPLTPSAVGPGPAASPRPHPSKGAAYANLG